MSIELLNIDCMEYMAGLPDKAFDLAIVDPPYGINKDGQVKTTGGNGGRKAHEFKGWDSEIPPPRILQRIKTGFTESNYLGSQLHD